MNIDFEIKKDENNIEKYRFYIDGNVIFLDEYEVLKREANQRKFRVIDGYSRLYLRNSTVKEQDVPLTEDIKQQIIKKFADSLVVARWSEKNK